MVVAHPCADQTGQDWLYRPADPHPGAAIPPERTRTRTAKQPGSEPFTSGSGTSLEVGRGISSAGSSRLMHLASGRTSRKAEELLDKLSAIRLEVGRFLELGTHRREYPN